MRAFGHPVNFLALGQYQRDNHFPMTKLAFALDEVPQLISGNALARRN